MKMNSLMTARWARVSGAYGSVQLHPALAELTRSPLIEIKGAVVLEGLFNPERDHPVTNDLVGFEVGVSKIHIEDYTGQQVCQDERLLQGIKYAEAIVAKLTSDRRPFRIILSRDPDSDAVVVLFYMRRPGQRWSSDDVEDYKLDEVAQWDT